VNSKLGWIGSNFHSLLDTSGTLLGRFSLSAPQRNQALPEKCHEFERVHDEAAPGISSLCEQT